MAKPNSANMQLDVVSWKFDPCPNKSTMSRRTPESVTGCPSRMRNPWNRGESAAGGALAMAPGKSPGGKRPGGSIEAPAVIHWAICGGRDRLWSPDDAACVCAWDGGSKFCSRRTVMGASLILSKGGDTDAQPAFTPSTPPSKPSVSVDASDRKRRGIMRCGRHYIALVLHSSRPH